MYKYIRQVDQDDRQTAQVVPAGEHNQDKKFGQSGSYARDLIQGYVTNTT